MQIDKKSVLNFYLNMKKIIARMIGDTNTPYLILDKLELDISNNISFNNYLYILLNSQNSTNYQKAL